MSPRIFNQPRLTALFAVVTTLVCGALLPSCTTLTKDQCLSGDWYSIGVNDGLLGRAHYYFELHEKACKKVDVEPVKETWLAGHKQGARQYCQPNNAYKEGLKGKSYHNICEPDQHRIFVALFRLGKEEYWLIFYRNYYAQQIASYERELDEKEAFWDKTGVDEHQSYSERKRIRRNISSARTLYLGTSDELARFRRRMRVYGMWQMAGLSEADKSN